MMPAPFHLDIPEEHTERRHPDRVIRDWLRGYQAECSRADVASCGCVATEAELLEMLGGEDPEWVIRREAQSITPSSGESGDHGPGSEQ